MKTFLPKYTQFSDDTVSESGATWNKTMGKTPEEVKARVG